MTKQKILIGCVTIWVCLYLFLYISPTAKQEPQECITKVAKSTPRAPMPVENITVTERKANTTNFIPFMRNDEYEELYEETDPSKCVSIPPEENMLELFWKNMMVDVSLGSCSGQVCEFLSLLISDTNFCILKCNLSQNVLQ